MFDQDALDRYRSGGFKEVFGWGMDDGLVHIFSYIDEFQRLNGISGPLAEIGVQDGRVAILFGLLARGGEKAYGIDIFENQSENLDRSGVNTSFQKVLENIKLHAPAADIELIKANSFRISSLDVDRLRGFRMMHIDGGHYIEVVMNDLELAQRTIGGGGVIIMDDYWHSGFPEVQEAVHKYFFISPIIKAAPFMVGRNKAFLASHEIRRELMTYIAERMPENMRKPVRVLGYDAIAIDPQW